MPIVFTGIRPGPYAREEDLEEFVEGMLRVVDEAHDPDAVHNKDDTDSDLDELDVSVSQAMKALETDEY